MRFWCSQLVAAAVFFFVVDALSSSAQDSMATNHNEKHSLQAFNDETKSQSSTTSADESNGDPNYHLDKNQHSDTTTNSAEDEERWFRTRRVDPNGANKASTTLTMTSQYGKWDRFLYKFLQKVLPGTIKDT